MEELLQAPTDGVGDAIVVPPVLSSQFELKIGLLNLVTAISSHGFENDDPHSHIRRFTKITQTVKLNQVPHDIIKLILFPFSLEGATRTWLEKEPPNSITTWNDLVSKFGESFTDAWDRFKDLLNKCPRHDFSPLHQIDTFYNGLNQSDQDSLNSIAGGNFLTRNTQEALTIIENKSKAIQEGCETCGGPHPYYECQAAGGYTQEVYATTGNFNSGGNADQPQGNRDLLSYRSNNFLGPPRINPAQPNVPSLEEMMLQHMRSTEAKIQQMQTYNNQQMQTYNNQQMQQLQTHNNQQIQQLQTQNNQMVNLMNQMQKVLHERPQGALPSNTEPNLREQVNSIMTRIVLTTAEPSIPPHVPPTPKRKWKKNQRL
ncbi:hypothetical protein Tco_1033597 [Tanacetum coccineum]